MLLDRDRAGTVETPEAGRSKGACSGVRTVRGPLCRAGRGKW